MINLMIHTPVNTRARVTNYLKEYTPQLTKDLDDEIIITSPHDFEDSGDCTDNWIQNCIRDNNLPDMVLTHASEFSVLSNKDFEKYFSPMAGEYTNLKPVRHELQPLVDAHSIFYPLFVVPIVMCINTNTVNARDLNTRWDDLFLSQYKATMPDKSKPITKIVGAHILQNYPQYFEQFEALETIFAPKQVMKSLMAQEHDIAISNTAFAKTAESKGIRINPTKDGVMILPQIVAFKKGVDKRLLKVIDYLLNYEIQKYLGENGFYPANPNATMGETISFDMMIKNFKGWNHYIDHIIQYEQKTGENNND